MFRKGILGGTFNPVHIGHLHLAQVALKALELDEVVFIPSYSPPHKVDSDLCSFVHRVAMLQRATASQSMFSVSTIEALRGGFSFTIDTLRKLHAALSPGEELVFIIGFDAFQEMGTWKEYLSIPEYATIAVCERDGSDITDTAKKLFGAHAALIQDFAVPERKVSSSCLRDLLAGDRQRAARFLPPKVFQYIEEYDLYL